jgi:hypothetical protein
MTLPALFLFLLIVDIDGVDRRPLLVESGKANVLFFVTDDCPISNAYAHEIARICADYKSQGIGCHLIYTDPSLRDDQARKHAEEYGHGGIPRLSTTSMNW